MYTVRAPHGLEHTRIEIECNYVGLVRSCIDRHTLGHCVCYFNVIAAGAVVIVSLKPVAMAAGACVLSQVFKIVHIGRRCFASGPCQCTPRSTV